VTGEITLPATLPPSDYALELSVHDRLEEKPLQGAAAQWVDFTLVKQTARRLGGDLR